MPNYDAIVYDCNSIFIMQMYVLMCLKVALVPVSRLSYAVTWHPQTIVFINSCILYTTCSVHKSETIINFVAHFLKIYPWTYSITSLNIYGGFLVVLNTGGLAHKDDPLLVSAGWPAPMIRWALCLPSLSRYSCRLRIKLTGPPLFVYWRWKLVKQLYKKEFIHMDLVLAVNSEKKNAFI